MAAQKSPVWSGDGFEGRRSEDTSSVEYDELNVDNLAIEVVGQNWSSCWSLFSWRIGTSGVWR